jgi:hypothetical protein
MGQELSAAEALAISRGYTDDTVIGVGAIKGSPCEIQSKTPIEGGTRVTFQWEATDGTLRTDYVDVMNGQDGAPGADGAPGQDGEQGEPGKGIKHTYVDNTTHHVIVVYDDDTTDDWGELTTIDTGSLEADLVTSVTVGGITSGTTLEAGTTFEQIFRDMMNPTAYPTLTNPSASLSATGAKLLEVGATLNTTFTITFSRGSINPAYGTSGYRSGVATGYTFDGETTTTNTFSKTITSAKTSYQGNVAYEAGEQPKNSVGGDYSTPLPAGSVNTNTVNYEFVNALWANTSNITTVAKLTLVSKSAKVKEFNFPAQTVANPEVFDVPANWTVTAVEVLNTLSNQWEDCSSEFTVADTTHDDAGGNSTAYKRYTDNRGYQAGARKVRVKWS